MTIATRLLLPCLLSAFVALPACASMILVDSPNASGTEPPKGACVKPAKPKPSPTQACKGDCKGSGSNTLLPPRMPSFVSAEPQPSQSAMRLA